MVNIFGFDKYIWIVNSGEIIKYIFSVVNFFLSFFDRVKII